MKLISFNLKAKFVPQAIVLHTFCKDRPVITVGKQSVFIVSIVQNTNSLYGNFQSCNIKPGGICNNHYVLKHYN
jgi:hypothetical protein